MPSINVWPVFSTPAARRKGRLQEGADADLVFLGVKAEQQLAAE